VGFGGSEAVISWRQCGRADGICQIARLQNWTGNSCQKQDNSGIPTQNVNLSDQQADFIRQSVGNGRFRNVSEVVRAGLRLLEQQKQIDRLKLRTLRRISKQAFDEIDRGDFELADDLDGFMARFGRKGRSTIAR
jgi:antitoxin ParD1/3/4